MSKTRKRRKQRTAHDHSPSFKKPPAKPTEPLDPGDTTETLDDATIQEMRELVERIEAEDLPPTQIHLIHHVKRPRAIAQDPRATVILKYTPTPPAEAARAEQEDAADTAKEGGHQTWNDDEPPQPSND